MFPAKCLLLMFIEKKIENIAARQHRAEQYNDAPAQAVQSPLPLPVRRGVLQGGLEPVGLRWVSYIPNISTTCLPLHICTKSSVNINEVRYFSDEIYRVAGKFELLDKILPKVLSLALQFC